MKFSTALRAIISAREYTQRELAKEIGIAPPTLSNMLRTGNPSIRVAARCLKPLGYQMVLMPVGAKRPADAYVVGDEA